MEQREKSGIKWAAVSVLLGFIIHAIGFTWYLATQTAILKEVVKDVADHETRIRRLEWPE